MESLAASPSLAGPWMPAPQHAGVCPAAGPVYMIPPAAVRESRRSLSQPHGERAVLTEPKLVGPWIASPQLPGGIPKLQLPVPSVQAPTSAWVTPTAGACTPGHATPGSCSSRLVRAGLRHTPSQSGALGCHVSANGMSHTALRPAKVAQPRPLSPCRTRDMALASPMRTSVDVAYPITYHSSTPRGVVTPRQYLVSEEPAASHSNGILPPRTAHGSQTHILTSAAYSAEQLHVVRQMSNPQHMALRTPQPIVERSPSQGRIAEVIAPARLSSARANSCASPPAPVAPATIEAGSNEQDHGPRWPQAQESGESPSDAACEVLRFLLQHKNLTPSQKEDLAFVLDVFEPHKEVNETEKRKSQMEEMELDASTVAFLEGLFETPKEHASFREVGHAVHFTTSMFKKVAIEEVDREQLMPCLGESKEVRQEMGVLASWSSFNVFKLDQLTNGNSLTYVALSAFLDQRLPNLFNIRVHVLQEFLASIQSQYHSHPYHNSIHAADVTQAVHTLLTTKCDRGLFDFSEIEALAMLFAATCHDVGHPGVTNDFRVQSADEGALTYNDRNVNENMHCSLAYRTLMQDGCNFLMGATDEQRSVIRKTFVDAVLATDMAVHNNSLKEFKAAIDSKGTRVTSWGSSQPALRLLLHCADISASSRAMPIALQWADCVFQEFFAQGDAERDMGRPVSPLCDRHSVSRPGSQLGFVNFVVRPTMEALGVLFDMREACSNLGGYADHWTREQAEEKRRQSCVSTI